MCRRHLLSYGRLAKFNDRAGLRSSGRRDTLYNCHKPQSVTPNKQQAAPAGTAQHKSLSRAGARLASGRESNRGEETVQPQHGRSFSLGTAAVSAGVLDSELTRQIKEMNFRSSSPITTATQSSQRGVKGLPTHRTEVRGLPYLSAERAPTGADARRWGWSCRFPRGGWAGLGGGGFGAGNASQPVGRSLRLHPTQVRTRSSCAAVTRPWWPQWEQRIANSPIARHHATAVASRHGRVADIQPDTASALFSDLAEAAPEANSRPGPQ